MSRAARPLQGLFLGISQVHSQLANFSIHTSLCCAHTVVMGPHTFFWVWLCVISFSVSHTERLGLVHFKVSSQMMMRPMYHSYVLHWWGFFFFLAVTLEKKDGKKMAITPRLSHAGHRMGRQKRSAVSHAQMKNLWGRRRRRHSRRTAAQHLRLLYAPIMEGYFHV